MTPVYPSLLDSMHMKRQTTTLTVFLLLSASLCGAADLNQYFPQNPGKDAASKRVPAAAATESKDTPKIRNYEDDMDRAGLIKAYKQNLDYVSRKKDSDKMKIGPATVTAGLMKATLQHLITLFESDKTIAEISAIINTNYRTYSSGNKGHITGYYDADYQVSKTKHDSFSQPVLSDKKKNGEFVPLAYISAKNLELLKIEGSGILKYEDGTSVRVTMAAKSPFRFKETGENGSSSAMQTPLVEGRSVAVDRRYIPLGTPVYLSSTKPVVDDNGNLTGLVPFGRFVAAQDTGGAIKGPARIDLFFGSGSKNVAAGKRMKTSGEVVLLTLKPEAYTALQSGK